MSESLIGGGQFIGPAPTPLGSGLARVLGLQGGQLGGVAAGVGGVIPVAVVADTSDAINRQLFARRFLSGRVVTPAAGQVLRFLFRSNPTADAIIEYFRIGGAAAFANPIGFGSSTTNLGVGLGAFTTLGASELGGQVPGSINYLGWGPSFQTGASVGFGSILVPPDTFDLVTRREWLIFAGGSFMVETNDVAVATRFSIQWREVPL